MHIGLDLDTYIRYIPEDLKLQVLSQAVQSSAHSPCNRPDYMDHCAMCCHCLMLRPSCCVLCLMIFGVVGGGAG
jgi:hypothetical protein